MDNDVIHGRNAISWLVGSLSSGRNAGIVVRGR